MFTTRQHDQYKMEWANEQTICSLAGVDATEGESLAAVLAGRKDSLTIAGGDDGS